MANLFRPGKGVRECVSCQLTGIPVPGVESNGYVRSQDIVKMLEPASVSSAFSIDSNMFPAARPLATDSSFQIVTQTVPGIQGGFGIRLRITIYVQPESMTHAVVYVNVVGNPGRP